MRWLLLAAWRRLRWGLLQIAVIEFARNVVGLKDANSAEFSQATSQPVVVFMPEISTTHKVQGGHAEWWGAPTGGREARLLIGRTSNSSRRRTSQRRASCGSHAFDGLPQGGTMRLGARRTVLQTVNCMAAKLYQKEEYIDERHRHRCAASALPPRCLLSFEAAGPAAPTQATCGPPHHTPTLTACVCACACTGTR